MYYLFKSLEYPCLLVGLNLVIGNGTKEIGTVFQVCGIDAEGAKLVDIGEQLAEGKYVKIMDTY